jgi:hypothetical protein
LQLTYHSAIQVCEIIGELDEGFNVANDILSVPSMSLPSVGTATFASFPLTLGVRCAELHWSSTGAIPRLGTILTLVAPSNVEDQATVAYGILAVCAFAERNDLSSSCIRGRDIS